MKTFNFMYQTVKGEWIGAKRNKLQVIAADIEEAEDKAYKALTIALGSQFYQYEVM